MTYFSFYLSEVLLLAPGAFRLHTTAFLCVGGNMSILFLVRSRIAENFINRTVQFTSLCNLVSGHICCTTVMLINNNYVP